MTDPADMTEPERRMRDALRKAELLNEQVAELVVQLREVLSDAPGCYHTVKP